MSILKSQNSISWVGCIANEIVLFCQQNIAKKHELLLLSSKGSLKVKLNPNQMLCLETHGKVMQLHSVKKHKNVIKERHHSRNGVQSFKMEFYQVSRKSYLQHRSQYFWSQLRKLIFVERIYQLGNFNTKFIGCHLSCLLQASKLLANEVFTNKFDMYFECSQLASWHAT